MSDNADKYDLISELFSKYKQLTFKVAFHFLRNKEDAEDVVQTSFLWMINNFEKFNHQEINKMPSYIAKIARRTSLNVISRRQIHPNEDIDEHEELSSDISVEGSAVEKAKINEIKKAIHTMPEKDRILLMLCLFEEKSYKEIAKTVGMSEENARVSVFRARHKLAELLRGLGIDYEY